MSAGHIRPRGPGAWELKYDLGRDPLTGKRQVRYKTVRGTKRDAQRELRRLLGAVDEGRHVDPSKLTVAEHLRARLAQWQASKKIGRRTAENRSGMIERHIAPYIGAIPIQQLAVPHIEGWHTSLRDRALCARSIRDAHIVLKAALDEAVKHGFAVRNVVALVKAPSATTAREVDNADDAESEDPYLTAEQVTETLKRLEGHPLYAPVAVALYTGVRRSELLALQWRHVDLEAREIKVRVALEETKAGGTVVKKPKTTAGRRNIRLPEAVVAALRVHRREQLEIRVALGLGRLPDDALVFPLDHTGGHISPRAFSLRWRRAVRSLGLPDVGFHALRHAHASMLIDAGVDIATIAARLGHASPAVTLRVYAHRFRKDDSKAADAIDLALGGNAVAN